MKVKPLEAANAEKKRKDNVKERRPEPKARAAAAAFAERQRRPALDDRHLHPRLWVKLQTAAGQAVYPLSKAIVQPVSG